MSVMSSPINITRLGRVGVLVVVGDVVVIERSLFLLNMKTLLGGSPRRRNTRITLHMLIHSLTLLFKPGIDKILLGSLTSGKMAFTQAPRAPGSSIGAS